jgi:hypothetical protein
MCKGVLKQKRRKTRTTCEDGHDVFPARRLVAKLLRYQAAGDRWRACCVCVCVCVRARACPRARARVWVLLSICHILVLEEAKHNAKLKFGVARIEKRRRRFQEKTRLL